MLSIINEFDPNKSPELVTLRQPRLCMLYVMTASKPTFDSGKRFDISKIIFRVDCLWKIHSNRLDDARK